MRNKLFVSNPAARISRGSSGPTASSGSRPTARDACEAQPAWRLQLLARSLCLVLGLSFAALATSSSRYLVLEGQIQEVAAHGGTDTFNPGTSCLRLSAETAPSRCVGAWLYLPNNNRHLLAASIAAKAGGGSTIIYVDTEAPQGHCPGRVFTPCQIASVSVR